MTDPSILAIQRISASNPFNDDTPPAKLIESYGQDLDDSVDPTRLDYLERELTAALYALWNARGIRKRIVKIT